MERVTLTQLLEEAKVFFEENYIANPPLILYQTDYGTKDIEKELEPTFSQILLQIIKEKGIPETECYKQSNLDRRLFSKIRSNTNYQPSKSTVIALCIGLGLDFGEAKKLLEVAGFSLSRSIKFDVIAAFLLKKNISDISTANEVLESFSCPLLGNNPK